MIKPKGGEVSLKTSVVDVPPESVVFGRSALMQTLRQKVHRVAGTNVPVLVTGESGTGKEILAKLLHSLSPWSPGPFVKVSCPAIPSTLLESELFGYEKGAFTGAYSMKPGRVEMADRGTLFLDEIGELEMGTEGSLCSTAWHGRVGDRHRPRRHEELIHALLRSCSADDAVEAERNYAGLLKAVYYGTASVNYCVVTD